MHKVYWIIIGVLVITCVVSNLVWGNRYQGLEKKLIKSEHELEKCLNDKNLTSQNIEKYIKEAREKDKINKKLAYQLNEIREVSNEEIVNNYHNLFNDIVMSNN